jgi:beta-lactamase regulating signal transducer with metallopeptidase domain
VQLLNLASNAFAALSCLAIFALAFLEVAALKEVVRREMVAVWAAMVFLLFTTFALLPDMRTIAAQSQRNLPAGSSSV